MRSIIRIGSLSLFLILTLTTHPALGVHDKYLWVSNFEDHTVSKIDVETHEVVATIPVGENPAGIAVGLDLVYVVCTRSSSVYRINIDTDAVYDVIDVSEVMEYPLGVALYGDGEGYAFVVGREFFEDSCPIQDVVLAKVNQDGLIEASTSLPGICGGETEIGIGINLSGDGFVPWERAYQGDSGIVHFSTDDLSYTDYDIHWEYYRGPGVGIDSDGNGWTAGARAGDSHTANFTKLGPGEGLTHYEIPEVLMDFDKAGDVLVDPQQAVWLGTTNGLFKLYPASGQIQYFDVGKPYGGLALDLYGYIWAVFPESNEVRKYDLLGNQVGPSLEVGTHPLGFGDMTGHEFYSICSDMDNDGYVLDDPFCMGDDCDDWNPATYPGAVEICDGLDNDCDGVLPDDEVDGDGDGWILCADCNDTDWEINPGIRESKGAGNCDDGLDNDCDGLVDTDIECVAVYVPLSLPTIQAGINSAVDGDLVLVASGTYVENINFIGKDITVKSEAGAEETIIDGQNGGSVVLFFNGETEGAVIEGFTIRNGKSHRPSSSSFLGGGIYCESSSPTIKNCKIVDNEAYGYVGIPSVDRGLGGGIFCGSASPTIINCIISGNLVCGMWAAGAGIYYEGPSSQTITNCTIADNFVGDYGFVGAGGGIYAYGGVSLSITNCIVWGNSAEIAPQIFGFPTVFYSDIQGGFPGIRNINSDPLFVGSGDYHLVAGSPCIDAGKKIWGIYKDIDGQRRPFGAGFDIGADEYSTQEPLPCSVLASSGNQFMALYMIPVLAFILLRRRRMIKK